MPQLELGGAGQSELTWTLCLVFMPYALFKISKNIPKYQPSGNNFVWKFRPNMEVSKFPTA